MTVSFPVDSRKVDVTGFRPLMEALSEACHAQGLDFFIVGALARDLVLIHLHELQPQRLTRDADVAVAVADWDDYEKLTKTLIRDYGFQKGDERQRLVAPGGALLDLIPFGAIEAERREIRWPPEEAFAMSTLGFREAYQAALTAIIDEELSVKVASLPGIGVMKLIAWRDRAHTTGKDAEDFCLLLRDYLDTIGPELYEEHIDLVTDEAFDATRASARIYGRDTAPLLKEADALREALLSLLRQETADPLDSRLARAMSCMLTYEQRFEALKSYLQGLEEKL